MDVDIFNTTITNAIFYMFVFLCIKNTLNGDPKAEILSNNLPLATTTRNND